MRRLKGDLPRGLKDHRTVNGVRYRRYVSAKANSLFAGQVPPAADVVLREAGRLAVELDRLEATRDALPASMSLQRRRGEDRRLRREQRIVRTQLLSFERRLEEMANSSGTADLARRLRAVNR